MTQIRLKGAAAEQGLNMARLSADELERNQHGSVLTFVYDESSTEKLFCDSTLPGRLSSLTQCKSRLLMVSPPPPFPADEKGFVGSLNKKTRVGLSNPVGYPTFESLRGQIKGTRLDTVGVNVFGNPSKKESLVMELRGMNSVSAPYDKIAKVLLGERCWVDWPYLSEAVISGISHESGHYDSDGFRSFSLQDFHRWKLKAHFAKIEYRNKKALFCGDSPFFIHVHLKKLRRRKNGKMEIMLDNKESIHPLQVVLWDFPLNKDHEQQPEMSQRIVMKNIRPIAHDMHYNLSTIFEVASHKNKLKGGDFIFNGAFRGLPEMMTDLHKQNSTLAPLQNLTTYAIRTFQKALKRLVP